MLISIAILVLGLVTLILGGEFLVRGASGLALRFHLSPLVIGLTIVAFGTSAPELLISIQSAMKGSPDLAMANVIGSNICNLALVLSITAAISPVATNKDSLRYDWPMTMGSSILLYVFMREGYIYKWEGILFVGILILYIVFLIRKSRRDAKAAKALEAEFEFDPSKKRHIAYDLGFIALGSAGLYFGSEWFVGSAQDIATGLGVSERIIGLTVLALGTSLPELVTAVVAALKKETDLALGNLLGSNIFNILSILGITSMIQVIEVNRQLVAVDMIWMLAITALLLPIMVTSKAISRLEGLILLSAYAAYIYFVTAGPSLPWQ